MMLLLSIRTCQKHCGDKHVLFCMAEEEEDEDEEESAVLTSQS